MNLDEDDWDAECDRYDARQKTLPEDVDPEDEDAVQAYLDYEDEQREYRRLTTRDP